MKNVAVVGFGFMGMTHTLNILRNPDLRLVAIVDQDMEGIDKKIKAESGNFSTGEVDPEIIKNINKYPDLSECLSHEALDAVLREEAAFFIPALSQRGSIFSMLPPGLQHV